jgi:hypothetical protein
MEQKKQVGTCESCVFYDYDEEYDVYECRVNLDQDELAQFLAGRTASCPFYRFYDEYKSVHKQI